LDDGLSRGGGKKCLAGQSTVSLLLIGKQVSFVGDEVRVFVNKDGYAAYIQKIEP
jgi:hypothetical protein